MGSCDAGSLPPAGVSLWRFIDERYQAQERELLLVFAFFSWKLPRRGKKGVPPLSTTFIHHIVTYRQHEHQVIDPTLLFLLLSVAT